MPIDLPGCLLSSCLRILLLTSLLLGPSCSGEDRGEGDPTLKLGVYRQNLWTRRVYELTLQKDSASLRGTLSLNSGTVEMEGDGVWTQYGEWVVIRVGAPASTYIGRIVPTGIELWQHPLPEAPNPLEFPELPQWIGSETDPEKRSMKRAQWVSTLELTR